MRIKKSIDQQNLDIEFQTPFLEFIMKELKERKKSIVYNLGTFEVLPGKAGQYWNMIDKKMTTEGKRKFRVRFKMSPKLKQWLKELESDIIEDNNA